MSMMGGYGATRLTWFPLRFNQVNRMLNLHKILDLTQF
jgi:hypothetical protein